MIVMIVRMMIVRMMILLWKGEKINVIIIVSPLPLLLFHTQKHTKHILDNPYVFLDKENHLSNERTNFDLCTCLTILHQVDSICEMVFELEHLYNLYILETIRHDS